MRTEVLYVEIPKTLKNKLRNYAMQNGINLKRAVTRLLNEGIDEWKERWIPEDDDE
jgi:hypothetical protein